MYQLPAFDHERVECYLIGVGKYSVDAETSKFFKKEVLQIISI